MNAATMSYGVRARERMPFAWDLVTLGLAAALFLDHRIVDLTRRDVIRAL